VCEEGDGGYPVCDIVEYACAEMERSDGHVDCGFLTDAAVGAVEWQAAHDCVLDAYAQRAGFMLTRNGAGEYQSALLGIAGSGYEVLDLRRDPDPEPHITMHWCTSLSEAPDCNVVPPAMCLDCPTTDDVADLCP